MYKRASLKVFLRKNAKKRIILRYYFRTIVYKTNNLYIFELRINN